MTLSLYLNLSRIGLKSVNLIIINQFFIIFKKMFYKFISLLIVIFLCNSCVFPSYKFLENSDGEPILNSELYTLNEKLTPENFKVIDTNSYYIATFKGLDSNEEQKANLRIYKFHSDGYFKKILINSLANFTKKELKNRFIMEVNIN